MLVGAVIRCGRPQRPPPPAPGRASRGRDDHRGDRCPLLHGVSPSRAPSSPSRPRSVSRLGCATPGTAARSAPTSQRHAHAERRKGPRSPDARRAPRLRQDPQKRITRPDKRASSLTALCRFSGCPFGLERSTRQGRSMRYMRLSTRALAERHRIPRQKEAPHARPQDLQAGGARPRRPHEAGVSYPTRSALCPSVCPRPRPSGDQGLSPVPHRRSVTRGYPPRRY